MNKNKQSYNTINPKCVMVLIIIMLGLSFIPNIVAAQVANNLIAPKQSIFYKLPKPKKSNNILEIQARINYKKPAGFRQRALFIKVNGKFLKPEALIERQAVAKAKNGKEYIYVSSNGGISIPFCPSATAFDKDKSYSLVSGKSVALYKFKLDGWLKNGTNSIELLSAAKNQTIIVEFVKFNTITLKPLTSPPVQNEADAITIKQLTPSTPPPGPAFSLIPGKDSKINWRGSELISGDSISYFDNESFEQRALEIKTCKDSKGWTVTNSWSENKDLPFRKELAVSPDGKTVELNIQFTQPAYKNRTDMGCVYSFKIPLKTIVDMNWTAIVGRTYKPKTLTGTLKANSPEHFIPSSTRWLAFEGNGKKIVFDFNPEGMQTYSDYGPNRIQGLWTVKKKGDYLECSFGRSSSIFGGTLNSKVVIFESEHRDFPNHHAQTSFNYYSEIPASVKFCFGAPKHGKNFIQVGNSGYDNKRGCGWLSSNIKINRLRPSGALYSAAYGNKSASFKSIVARKGLYLITARIGTGSKAAGPMSITCNNRQIANNFSVKPATGKTITWSQWLESGVVEFKFNGNWRISTLAMQMLQHSNEDYTFRRGFWRFSGLYEPAVILKSAFYAKPAKLAIAISSTPLPLKVIQDISKTVIQPSGKTCLPNQQSPAMAWRFNVNLGSLGPNNWGNFDEFNTPALLRRRLAELKQKNINAILLNGNLSRHIFPNQMARMEKMIAMIVKEAHKQNIKVIDHLDLTVLWNMGTGFRVLAKHPDWLQRTITSDLPTHLYCPVNPAFKQHFFDWMIKHIKATNIDGFMIDEETFGGISFCGCASCRKQFTDSTGLTLPLDETSPLLNNKKSKLWRSWLKWRIQVLADWCVELKERTNKLNPNLTFMRYTTHYGFASNYATIKFGASLAESARACDFLGTEIMSRNVYVSCRGVFAFRKLKTSLREAYGSPVFGLIYPLHSPEIAYFGWAINNMNNQGTWFVSDIPKNSSTPDFTAFKANMDRQLAKPVAPIAMLFSTQSRDWPQMMAYYVDPMGFGEAMNDLHYQYTTLIEPSLTLDKLKQYKTVIVPSASCLSDQQIKALLQFAAQGGKLILTAHTGMFDAMGNKRSVWPFAEPLGIKNPLPVKLVQGGSLSLRNSQATLATKQPFIKLAINSNKTKIFMTLLNGGEKYPTGITVAHGSGSISYISSQIGRINMEVERSYKQKWPFEWNQAAFEFQRALFKQQLNTGSSFSAIQIPRKVFATVYKQTKKGKTHTLVHLLNATGVNIKKGQTVPGTVASPAFSELAQDIKFKIKLSDLKNAYITSPDFARQKSVKTTKLANGWYEITIPKELLKCYSLIWLED